MNRHVWFVLGVMLATLILTASPGAQSTPVSNPSPPSSQMEMPAADREQWQRVPDIVRSLKLESGSRVADVGAGAGFFSVRLARLVGAAGRVYAVDANPRMITRLRERAEKEQLTNLEIVLGDLNDPKLPVDSLDAALIVNAYHEMDQHQAMLGGIGRALKPGGRLVIVEPTSRVGETYPRERQALSHEISLQYVEQDLVQAGFEIVDRDLTFATMPGAQDDHHFWMLVATRPGRRVPSPGAGR